MSDSPITEAVGSQEGDKVRNKRIAKEVTQMFTDALAQEGLPSPINPEVLERVFGRMVKSLHPDAADYTPGLDRMVAVVEGLKKTGWVLIPNAGRGSTLLIKAYGNMILHMRFLDTGSIQVEFHAKSDIPALGMLGMEAKNMKFPELDSLLIAALQSVHGGFKAIQSEAEKASKS